MSDYSLVSNNNIDGIFGDDVFGRIASEYIDSYSGETFFSVPL